MRCLSLHVQKCECAFVARAGVEGAEGVREHAVGLNLVAVGGLAPTVWGWRKLPVWRWFVLGSGVGVAGAWLALLAMALGTLSR